MTAPGTVPLARLFATAFRDLIEALHEGLSERGWGEMRAVYGFVLLSASSGPTSASQVASLLGTSKQAAAKLLDQMVSLGYLERGPDEHDRRVVRVSLTERGRHLLRDVEAVYAGLEAQWAEVIGADAVERLRTDLEAVLRARHDGELPAVRPTW